MSTRALLAQLVRDSAQIRAVNEPNSDGYAQRAAMVFDPDTLSWVAMQQPVVVTDEINLAGPIEISAASQAVGAFLPVRLTDGAAFVAPAAEATLAAVNAKLPALNSNRVPTVPVAVAGTAPVTRNGSGQITKIEVIPSGASEKTVYTLVRDGDGVLTDIQTTIEPV